MLNKIPSNSTIADMNSCVKTAPVTIIKIELDLLVTFELVMVSVEYFPTMLAKLRNQDLVLTVLFLYGSVLYRHRQYERLIAIAAYSLRVRVEYSSKNIYDEQVRPIEFH